MSPRSTRTHRASTLTRSLTFVVPLLLLVGVAFGEQDDDAKAVGFNEPFTIYAFLPEYRPIDRALVACATPNARVLAFSAELTAEGTLSEVDRVVSKEKLTTKDCRLDLVVGGGGRSGGFPSLVKEKLARRVAEEVARALREHGFDGVSYDWEYPQSREDWSAYSALLRETRLAIGDEATLSVSVHLMAESFQMIKDFEITEHVDVIHVMAYDAPVRGDGHSSLDLARRVMEHTRSVGIQGSKLTLGVPFYGRSLTQPSEAKAYEEIRRDYVGSRPFEEVGDVVDGFGFNSIETVKAKVALAKEYGYGGVMIWELGQDAEDESSLFAAIVEAVAMDASSTATTTSRDEL
jgi:GH18 family chitinase